MSQPVIVHFPRLMPEAPTSSAPAGDAPRALFLEPGLRRDPDPHVFLVPPDLPMDRREARAWLAQSMEFAGRFTHRGDMSGMSAAGVDDFYTGSSLDLQSRLRSMDGSPDGSRSGEDPEVPARRRAQMVLLLATGLQERLAEIGDLNRRLGDAWQGLHQTLGLEDDDGTPPHVMAVSPVSPASPSGSSAVSLDNLEEHGLSWPMLLESVFCLLPPDALLLTNDASLPRAWEDMGLELTPMADPPSGMPAGVLSGSAPAHAWCGREAAPADRPWLAVRRTVIHVPAHGGTEEPS